MQICRQVFVYVWTYSCMLHMSINLSLDREPGSERERERGRERERERQRERGRERESLKTTTFLLPVQDQIPHGLLAAVKGKAWGEPVTGGIFASNAIIVEEGATLPQVGKKFNYFGSGIHCNFHVIYSIRDHLCCWQNHLISGDASGPIFHEIGSGALERACCQKSKAFCLWASKHDTWSFWRWDNRDKSEGTGQRGSKHSHNNRQCGNGQAKLIACIDMAIIQAQCSFLETMKIWECKGTAHQNF